MPAIIVVSLGDGLAEPDLSFGAGGGQRHHRHQPSTRHEMLIIEDHPTTG
jgi:hypothetical protein